MGVESGGKEMGDTLPQLTNEEGRALIDNFCIQPITFTLS